MTKLRDDGMLETDEAIVAACFLGRRGENRCDCGCEDKNGGIVCSIEKKLFLLCDCDDGSLTASSSYPILIAAETVSVVWDMSDMAANVLTLAILKLPWTGHDISEWLHTHTQEEAK